jgi:hypothetical protein
VLSSPLACSMAFPPESPLPLAHMTEQKQRTLIVAFPLR